MDIGSFFMFGQSIHSPISCQEGGYYLTGERGSVSTDWFTLNQEESPCLDHLEILFFWICFETGEPPD